MADSPTQTVGFQAVSELKKRDHPIPLLSLDKTKSVEELVSFSGEHQILLMLKLDGLMVKLTYEDGKLIEASTRGDGDTGEIITHNVRGISGIPQHIPHKERLVVSGEAWMPLRGKSRTVPMLCRWCANLRMGRNFKTKKQIVIVHAVVGRQL